MGTLKSDVYGQLARTKLLSQEQSAEILAGGFSTLQEDIIMPLLIGAMDCEAMTGCDPKSTWTERRMARLGLILAFLLALGAASRV
jgi:hypothetical protein